MLSNLSDYKHQTHLIISTLVIQIIHLTLVSTSCMYNQCTSIFQLLKGAKSQKPMMKIPIKSDFNEVEETQISFFASPDTSSLFTGARLESFWWQVLGKCPTGVWQALSFFLEPSSCCQYKVQRRMRKWTATSACLMRFSMSPPHTPICGILNVRVSTQSIQSLLSFPDSDP